tara:strand:- start:149 stop:697 length:549 start_codon:yes stop_codon:yes gene_type:complete
MLGEWFCVLTNFVCTVPIIICYKKQLIIDASLIAITGGASFIYHFNRLIYPICDQVAIRNTDIIMANLIVIHTGNCILFRFSNMQRVSADLLWLPVVIYTAESVVTMRLIGMGVFGVLCQLWWLHHKVNYLWRWMTGGVIGVCVQLVFFNTANAYGEYYEWLHGMHHIMAFTSQASFIYGIL